MRMPNAMRSLLNLLARCRFRPGAGVQVVQATGREVREHRPASVIATVMVGASMSTVQAFKWLKRTADAIFARRC